MKCSFCGKAQDFPNGRRLVAGPDVAICAECVRLCVEVLEIDPPEPEPDDGGYFARDAPRRWPRWHPTSRLGMAVRNRLHEWRWTVSYRLHRLVGREMPIAPRGFLYVPAPPTTPDPDAGA